MLFGALCSSAVTVAGLLRVAQPFLGGTRSVRARDRGLRLIAVILHYGPAHHL